MIKLENTEVTGWKHAVRGMRNPMNSWEMSDSITCRGGEGFEDCHANVYGCPRHEDFSHDVFCIGKADLDLMTRLRDAGTDHRKFMRMITVYVDITAPLYWWKEFDTYKVGTVANSCSTMHKIHSKEFTLNDFSHEKLLPSSLKLLQATIDALNTWRNVYMTGGMVIRGKHYEVKDKEIWWQMIQLLPTSYNQRRTVMLNYEVLANIYKSRKNHKLDEWRNLCEWIKTLPNGHLITGEEAGHE